ncbi:MAG: hypothetical protein ACYDCO_12480 [Armatimonadota bacterium]
MIDARQEDISASRRGRGDGVTVRLLWKEACQAWPWYLLGALVAVLAIPWVLPREMYGWQGQVRDYPWMLVTLAMCVRGALLGTERFRHSYATAHFSIHPERMPAFAFGVNLLGVLLLGLAAGGWFAAQRDPMLLAPIMFFFAVAFLLGYVVAAVFGKSYAGILAGIPWLFFYQMFSDHLRTPESPNVDLFYGVFDQVLMYSGFLAGGLLAVAFLLLSRRLPLLLRRSGMVCCLALGVASSMVIMMLQQGDLGGNRDYYAITDQRMATSDGARAVEFIWDSQQRYYTLHFADYRRQLEARQRVEVPYLLLGFDGPDSVLLLGQRRWEGRMHVVRWWLAENRLEPVFSFRIRRGALHAGLANSGRYLVSLRPDGRYAALQLPSLLGENAADLWLLDLRRKQARLVLVDWPGSSLAWKGNNLVTGTQVPQRISLTTGKISPFPIKLQEVRR